MLQLIKNSIVLLRHYKNFIQCCLVQNFTFPQTTKTFSILVTHHSDVFAGSSMLINMGQNYTMWKAPHNVIANTFSRLSRNNESSPLVGKKATNAISDSESDNDNESLYLSIIDDKEILDCLQSLPCISSNRKQKKRRAKHRKIHHQICHHDTDTSWQCRHQNHCHHNDTAEQCYLNLPEDMIEDNPLDWRTSKKDKTKMTISCSG